MTDTLHTAFFKPKAKEARNRKEWMESRHEKAVYYVKFKTAAILDS
jgi:hypothetical protein